MNWKVFTPKFLVISAVIIAATLLRLLPHYPNFTPIAALALFGGAHLGRKKLAFLVPLLALFISDLFLGFHEMMIAVYLSVALIVFLGSFMHGRIRAPFVLGGAFAGALIFFVITNFAVWAMTPYYPNTFQGLITCYTMAIPFFHTTLLGDLFYSAVFFGGFYFVQVRYPALKTA